ncbi:MAG: HAD family phosphatase, partial [Elusimicrobia bacterium]|nr:HAD family phosphatase [Elusimicrobiota bacterium]
AIRAVFFDIGNVLLHFDIPAILKEISAALGRHPIKVARSLLDTKRISALERGELDSDELYRIFREELGYRGSFPKFKKLWCDHFSLERRTAALLKKVSRRVPTYLLSNTHALHYDFIKARYAFIKCVRGAALSHELGMRKPEPRIFRAALQLAGVSAPAQALFIDDLEPNVQGARKAGLQAILYRGPEDLARRLKSYGLLA